MAQGQDFVLKKGATGKIFCGKIVAQAKMKMNEY